MPRNPRALLTIPQQRRAHTLLALGYGAVVLVWLTPEDRTVWPVVILGSGLGALLGGLAVLRWGGGTILRPAQWIPGLVLGGALVGVLAVWSTISLMIFKNAWHSHAYPDFPTSLIVDMAARTLPWSVAGACLGGALALLRWAWVLSSPPD
ncbi:MAG: hypothetical protein ACLFTK_10970 [Anaerolineales bacterium]